MIKNNFIFISFTTLVLFSSFFLSGCGKKSQETKSTPTPIDKELKLTEKEKPIISLIPSSDGHNIKLKIENIPKNITEFEYDLIYSAVDEGLEMEKGAGDTIKVSSNYFEKDILMGTASCTSGCKYKYDTGVVGGTLSITFISKDNQSLIYESSFALKTSTDIKKDGGLSLKLENFNIKATTVSKNDYFIVIKNLPSYYSVFSSGNGTGKITGIIPESITKEDNSTLVGNYLIN